MVYLYARNIYLFHFCHFTETYLENPQYASATTKNTRSQAVARISDRTAKNCRGHV